MTPIDSVNEEITMRRVIQGYMIMIKIASKKNLKLPYLHFCIRNFCTIGW